MTTRYGTGARIFHWLVVILLVVQIPAGIAMIAPGLAQEKIDALYVVHKGLGAILLLVIVLRILWRITHRAPAMPAHWPPLEKTIAERTHVTIYVVLLVLAVSGYVHVVGGGFPIELLDRLGIPPLIPKMEGVAVIASLVHRYGSFLLIGLVAVHVAEVLRHALVEKDGELRRMWPPVGGGDDAPPS